MTTPDPVRPGRHRLALLPPDHSSDCVFCRIAAGTAPAQVILKRPRVLAILDVNPIHPGHALILPKEHHQDLLAVPPDLLPELTAAVQDVARALVRTLELPGFNVFSNNGRVAGQSVFHAHIHVTPRYPHDGIRFVPAVTHYGAGEMERMADRLRRDIDAQRSTHGE
jgi:histidine triad (HIT) family protein